ncbi:MAG: hypothetical protein LBB64_07060, partial [Dysgonamonadaceae bacterium]|nr:hypothetical protein [Dysgonamonadaceae bacterium]
QTYNGSISFPASGYRIYGNGKLDYVGTNGYYWGGSAASGSSNAYRLSFNGSNVDPTNDSYRLYGFVVRCVKN